MQSKESDRKAPANLKYLSSRVVSTVTCALCGKKRCIFSLDGKINPRCEQQLEDIIFSCGMNFESQKLYAARYIKCTSLIEHAYYAFNSIVDLICVHCGAPDINQPSYLKKKEMYKTVYPSCLQCITHNKNEVCSGLKPKKKVGAKSNGACNHGNNDRRRLTKRYHHEHHHVNVAANITTNNTSFKFKIHYYLFCYYESLGSDFQEFKISSS